jgi:hypothetical protein
LELEYETGLRPETIACITWEDWEGSGLRIRAEIDKARFARVVPLSDRAREILSALQSPGATGPFFDRHDYRPYIAAACEAAGQPRISPYDLRHNRGTHLAERGNLPAVAFSLGHRRATATGIHVHPGRRAAEQMLKEDDVRRGIGQSATPGTARPHVRAGFMARRRRHAPARAVSTEGTPPQAPPSAGSTPSAGADAAIPGQFRGSQVREGCRSID